MSPMGNNVTACGDQMPCFTCNEDGKSGHERKMPQVQRTLSTPGYEVELAVSPLAGLKGAAGYHSSILIEGDEYFFSPMGIIHSPNISSHKKNPAMQRIFIGLSKYSGSDLVEFFDNLFPPGHYDLLRKNCNSFSDCALYFLCEQRLDLKWRAVERFGCLADDHYGIVQSISGGEYVPNPQAVGFDLDAVIAEVDAERPAPSLDDFIDKSVSHVFQMPEAVAAMEKEATAQNQQNVGELTTPPESYRYEDFKGISSTGNANPGEELSSPSKPPCHPVMHGYAGRKSFDNAYPNRSISSEASGPTDPLGITYNAPAIKAWTKKAGPQKETSETAGPKKEPLSWDELRKMRPNRPPIPVSDM